MEISRHKTRNVFDRYHIVSSKRQKQLGERLERYLQEKMLICEGGAEMTTRVSIDPHDPLSGTATGEDNGEDRQWR